ncbi:MAG: 2-oxoacid:acceptor oxidoreductase family protein [Myxococcales bacterium]|jgi:2-oxoglutarate ferredoxin oxidoreductase subunit gamma|nr:2-oxoacid:acceptor oxidoreductase family protein [Myxococcales bacterium]
MASSEIKIGGLGGQGVIMAGMILGKAASLHDEKFATLIQAFGPEARGAACSAQVLIDDDPILYPYVVSPQFLVTLSQDAFRQFAPELREGGVLMFDEDMVTLGKLPPSIRTYGLPAMRLAESLGRKQVLNLIVVGFFTAITGLVSEAAARAAIRDTVPPSTIALNLHAFEVGFAQGKSRLADKTN